MTVLAIDGSKTRQARVDCRFLLVVEVNATGVEGTVFNIQILSFARKRRLSVSRNGKLALRINFNDKTMLDQKNAKNRGMLRKARKFADFIAVIAAAIKSQPYS